MLVTVQGTYENGRIELDEPVPTADQTTRRVLVTFLETDATPVPAPRHRFAWQASPLSEQAESTVSVADEVVAERQERD